MAVMVFLKLNLFGYLSDGFCLFPVGTCNLSEDIRRVYRKFLDGSRCFDPLTISFVWRPEKFQIICIRLATCNFADTRCISRPIPLEK